MYQDSSKEVSKYGQRPQEEKQVEAHKESRAAETEENTCRDTEQSSGWPSQIVDVCVTTSLTAAENSAKWAGMGSPDKPRTVWPTTVKAAYASPCL